MHDSEVTVADLTSRILAFSAELASPETRQEAAAALARLLGGEDLILFAPDPELGVTLPAIGLTQVLRPAAAWRTFVDACVRDGTARGELPGPDGDPRPAVGAAVPDGTAAVLTGRDAGRADLTGVVRLLPLLGALFRAERQLVADEVRARSAADAIERARILNRTLQEMRDRLSHALVDARHARGEAKARAEQAESLASELQAQAAQLEEQAVELELLNDELAARTLEAERARAAADSANRAKSEFLANMSHELRTPINAVIGYAELLNMGISGPVTEVQQAQLERIRASSAHLLSLVNDVLDMSKVEAGRMTVRHERERIVDVAAAAFALIEMEAAAHGITLENRCDDPEITFVGDRDRARQILVNLLSNAVKFTEEGGRVIATTATTEDVDASAQVAGDGPWTSITVEDTGIGMSEDQLPRIFQPFVQEESGRTRRHGGTGLGLTISRQLARLMGGDLTVRSRKGVGSSFTLWLPAESGQTAPLDATARAPAHTRADAASLAEAGALLQTRISDVLASHARRVRHELLADFPYGMDQSEVEDHAAVFVADLAGLFVKLGRSGGTAARSWESSSVQRLLAAEHGADRGRRGWTAAMLRREYDILREELVAALLDGSEAAPALDLPGVTALLDEFIGVARRASLASHGAASVGSSS